MKSCISSLFRTRAAALAAALLFFALPTRGEVVGALSPHHGVAGALIDRLYARIAEVCPSPARVIVIGPDHFRRAKHNIVIGASDWGRTSILRGDVEGATMTAVFLDPKDVAGVRLMTDHLGCRVLALDGSRTNFTCYAGALWSKRGEVADAQSWHGLVRSFREGLEGAGSSSAKSTKSAKSKGQ